jgi:glycosyltransferase involved in cell wall biosynthesis
MAYRFSELWKSSKWALTDNDRHMLEHGANQCKAIVTCSECSRRDIILYLNVPGSKVTSIPWGVNREMFKPTNDDEYLKNIGIEGLYYFTSSANHPRKNLPLLLESYREYLKLGGRGQLVVLNPEEEHLHGIIDLIEEGRIVILRKISDKELAALYTNAKCSLVLSSYEGFGLPVLESLACGTQVLCARNSSLVEAGGGVVDYIDEMNSTIIAHKILNYDTKEKTDILDEVLLEEHLQNFTWEKCARKYIEFYKTQLGI